MAIRITHIRKEAGPTSPENAHLDIRAFRWINEQSQAVGESPREEMYDWIVNKKGQAYVRDAQGNPIYVFGAVSPSGRHFIRAVKNQTWSDDLLQVPTL